MADFQAHFEEEHTEHLSKTSLREERNPYTDIDSGVQEKNGPITTKESKVRTTKKNATRKLFPCVVCKKKFSMKTNMKAHVRKIHFAKVVSPAGLLKKSNSSCGSHEANQTRPKYFSTNI